MASNFSDDLPDIITSSYLGDREFGECINIDEHRIRNDFLGSRFCKITYDGSKGVKSKKPSKKVSDSETCTLVEESKRKLRLDEGYDAIKFRILDVAEKFRKYLIAAGGPLFLPVLFFAHSDKHDGYNVREKKRRQKQPIVKNAFPFHVLNNITRNLKAEIPVYTMISNTDPKPVCLNKETTVEQAFVKLLETKEMKSEPWEESDFADDDEDNWKIVINSLSVKSICNNPRAFVIEFACIFPENIHSTVYVSCRCCGIIIHTLFNDYTWKAVKNDLQINTVYAKNITHNESSVSKSTIALPARSVTANDSYIVTSIIGATPLTKMNPTKPSCFIRVCMYVNCAEDAIIPAFIHGNINRLFEEVTINE